MARFSPIQFGRLAGAVLALALPAAAQAEMPVTYESGGRALFHFDVPDFWTVQSGGLRSLTPPGGDEARAINRVIGMAPTADDGVWVGFTAPNGVRTLEQAVEYLQSIGSSLVHDPEITETSRLTIGGRPAARIAGTGRRDRKAVSFTALVIGLPSGQAAVSVAVMEAGAEAGLVADINAIYASFRAAR